MTKTLKLILKLYLKALLFVAWIPLKYLEITIYSKVSPNYLRTAQLLELKKWNSTVDSLFVSSRKETKNTVPNFRNLAQEVSSEDYYNILQEAKK